MTICFLPISKMFALALTAIALAAPAAAQGPATGTTTARPGGAGSAPGAPPRDPSAPTASEKGTGIVRGRVVALDTGQPLRRARVTLFGPAGKPRAATTDDEGTFSFGKLPAGRYDVRASKTRYVDSPLGARRPGGPGKPIHLADGQTLEGLVISLPPAGVITGRVVDDAGDPVTGVNVTPMRYRSINGERRLSEFGRFRTTDDTGAFRVYGLPPGVYYLSAQPEESRQFGFAEDEPDAMGFAPTFYPGTPVAGDAQPIEVVAGAEIVADVQLVSARLTTVTGVVVDQAGTTATGGYIMVNTRTGTGSHGSSAGEIKADGTFTATGIAPGEHTLIAEPRFGPAPTFESNVGAGSEARKRAYAPIVATGSPITGLRLVVQDPVRIPVNVTFEDGGSADKPERITVSAYSDRAMSSGMAVMRDGRLSLEVMPGTYRISAGTIMSPGAAAPRWMVKRVAYRGREVQDDEVELTAEPGGRIDIVFTTRSSGVSGTVTDDAGKPIAEYTVIILPEDPAALRRGAFPRIRTATADPQGRFDVKYLRAGSYLATAIADAPIEDIGDPDFLESLRKGGKPFTLAEGGTATLALKLTPLP
jgi:hypothetical protein